MTDTANAPERKVFDEWFQDTFKDPDGSLEHLPKWFLEDAWLIWKASATHHDERVAAAYLDAIEIIRMLPELILMNADQVRAIEKAGNVLSRSGARTNASAALTAYGERMKAEGAREAQAKIARLTEALKVIRDRHINPNNGFAGEHYAEVRRFAGAALQETAND